MSSTADAPAMTTLPGSLLLFRFRDIPVFVHWSWGVVALLVVAYRASAYGSVVYNLFEYVGLFTVVLMHEFGHALACRSVGGTVSHILLWPLGGVAHVRPPQRPGAVLWSIAAGPLVNLMLAPIAIGASLIVPESFGDLRMVLYVVAVINVGLFVFNMLPVYPLDGGQILRSLLWFVIGRERSLVITAGLGLVLACLGAAWALDFGVVGSEEWSPDVWLALVAAYAAYHSWRGLRAARTLLRLAAGPRHRLAQCPSCGEAPPAGLVFRCDNGHLYDAFVTQGTCPECGLRIGRIQCIFCAQDHAPEGYAVERPIGFGPPAAPGSYS